MMAHLVLYDDDGNVIPNLQWEETKIISCGKILRNRTDIIEQRCPKCRCYSIRWMHTIESKFCPHCGEKVGGWFYEQS